MDKSLNVSNALKTPLIKKPDIFNCQLKNQTKNPYLLFINTLTVGFY